MWIERDISRKLLHQIRTRPATLLTGARQTGKSSLLKKILPDAEYVSLDRPALAAEAESNPHAFLSSFSKQVIIDEIQYAPSLFRELKILIDDNRQEYGRWALTGSQLFSLMRGVSESLAGRISILNLDTLTATELHKAQVLSKSFVWIGGYPEIWSQPQLDQTQFFNDYIATYLQRDLRQIISVDDLRVFDHFLRMLALRAGSLINLAEIGRDIGMTGATVKKWLAALEASHLISIVEPWYVNHNKRIIKTPKVFFKDQGLLCQILGIRDEDTWLQSPLKGHLYENFVFCEIQKMLNLTGSGRKVFFWRDKDNREVDFLVENGPTLTLIESKFSENPPIPMSGIEHVEKVFSGQYQIRKIIACQVDSNRILKNESYELWNPLRSELNI
ncbi:MAG: ATP-binding protein [Oligoflexus sp.]